MNVEKNREPAFKVGDIVYLRGGDVKCVVSVLHTSPQIYYRDSGKRVPAGTVISPDPGRYMQVPVHNGEVSIMWMSLEHKLEIATVPEEVLESAQALNQ